MRTRLVLFVLVPLLTLGGGCGDDSTTSGGPPDTTPPGVSNVAAVDANHLTVTFSEAVNKATAETPQNYSIVESTPAARSTMDTAAPGDTTHVGTAILDSDQKTVTITTQEAMGVLPYDMTVMGVQDLAGNVIETPVTTSFTGSNASDTTPPQVVLQSPAPGATGVAIATTVTVQFNEPMNASSVQGAFQWTNSASVPWQMQETGDNTFVFTPQQTLQYNTVYTINVSTGAQDAAGNGLANPVVWTFRTTASPDNTPPTLLSSTPANNATNVPVTTNIILTFSEPIDTMLSLENVFLSPDVGDGDITWSPDLTMITFNPYVDLLDNTTYSLAIPPGDLRDAAGNGNSSIIQIVWSTGATLATGRFSGVVSGDPGTPAANPAGALVVAAQGNLFGPGGDDFGIGGTGVVMSGGGIQCQQSCR